MEIKFRKIQPYLSIFKIIVDYEKQCETLLEILCTADVIHGDGNIVKALSSLNLAVLALDHPNLIHK